MPADHGAPSQSQEASGIRTPGTAPWARLSAVPPAASPPCALGWLGLSSQSSVPQTPSGHWQQREARAPASLLVLFIPKGPSARSAQDIQTTQPNLKK